MQTELNPTGEDLLSFALAIARVGAWELDLETHAAERTLLHDQIFGYPDLLPHWSYEMFLEHVVPADRAEVDRKFRHAVETGTDWTFECRIRRRDGAESWIWATGRVLPAAPGRNPRIAGIVQDITERKHAEEAADLALRASEERFRSVLQESRDVLYRVNIHTGQYEYISPSAGTIVGYTADELAAMDSETSLAMVHPEDLPGLRAAIKRVEETGTADVEYRQSSRNGEYIWISNHMSLVRDASGRPLYRNGNIRDVTASKRAEEMLQQAHARQSYLLTLSDALRALSDPIEIQQAAARVLGEHLGVDPGSDHAAARVWAPEEAALIEETAQRTRDAVERARSESSVRERDQRLTIAKDAARLGIYEYDAVTGEVHWDDRVREFWGLEPDEPVTYERFLSGVHPEDRAQLQATAARALDPLERKDYSHEYRVIRGADREVRWMAATGQASFKDGRAVRLIGTLQDITERKAAESALQLSERRLRAFVQATTQAIWTADATGYSPEARAWMQEFTGIQPTEGAPISWIRCAIHPDDDLKWETLRRRAAETKGPLDVEVRVRRKDGVWRWVRVSCVTVPDADGTFREWVGTIADVTEQKTSQDALLQSEQRFRTMADETPVMIWVTDKDGRVEFVNHAYLVFFGVTVEDLRSGGWQPLVHPEDQEAYVVPFLAALKNRTAFDAEARVRRADGEWRWVRSVGRPRFGADGEFLGIAGSSPDVTDRRLAEAALREADQRKNQFLATLSHELRNPLAPITNSLYILDRAVPGGDEARQAQTIIERQVRQLTRLIDDLLDVTRITTNKIRLRRERLELNELVRRIIEDHRSVFHEGGVDLEFEPAPAPVHVDGDWSRLGQCLGNLLQNAAKFTEPSGRATVSISSDPAARRAILEVADTGAGMTSEVLAGLFEPFVQADTTLDRSKGGLGLGLALVKGIVELHGGTVAASSAGLGQGSVFTIHLPLDLTAPAGSESKRLHRAPVRHRVLIIEDNPDAANSLKLLLRMSGHEVEVAFDGSTGLAKAKALCPEVVLCDIGLPEMDGYEVARVFRSDEALKNAYLVALSGYSLPEDLQRAADAGFDYHLAKPPEYSRLEGVLNEMPRGIGNDVV